MATTGINVSYNGIVISPSPLVNFSNIPVQYGYLYGYNSEISLKSFYTGITTSGNAINFLTGIFSQQFQTLLVTDNNNNTLYNWPNITVDSISIDPNTYFIGSFVPYTVKLKSYSVPSGVTDISNAYEFQQNEDSTVSVNHKISARGVRNLNGAFQNAILFCQQFQGIDPFSVAAPLFVPSGSGVWMSRNENINRIDSIYSITENYRYSTGLFAPYTKTTSLDISESINDEYRNINYGVKLQGSPIINNVASVISSLNYTMLTDIANDFGISTSNWVKNGYEANVDSGEALIDIKVSYLSGASASGFFDYVVSLENDYLNNTENWKIQGEFVCFGMLEYKLQQLNNFISANESNSWRTYLTGLIGASPIFAANHDTGKLFSQNPKVVLNTNTGLGTLTLSLDWENGYEPVGLADLSYTLEASPARWIYELLPAATIEGEFVVQDLRTQSQPRQKFSLSAKTYNTASGLSLLNGYMTNLVGGYVVSGTENAVTNFLTDENIDTGIYDVSHEQVWLGQDVISTGILFLQSIGSSTATIPTRPSGWSYGY